MKFDVGQVIESSIIEAANGKCTGGRTHLSTITMFCKIAGVRFSEYEERCLSMLSLLLPKVKKTPQNSWSVVESGKGEMKREMSMKKNMKVKKKRMSKMCNPLT